MKKNFTGNKSIKVKILNNRVARISGDSDSVMAIDKLLTCKDPSARFTKAFRMGYWDGNIRFLTDDRRFSVGLIGEVNTYCVKNSVEFSILDERKDAPVPGTIPTKIGKLELRDYQYDIVKAALYRKVGETDVRFPRGIISAATNAGKSLIAAAIFKSLRLANKPIQCLYLCHKVEIFDQVVSWFKEYFDDEVIGVYNSKQSSIKPITVAMITTLHARRNTEVVKEILENFGCIMVDEAHRASADSWAEVIHSSKAYYKFGLSGTAMKMEPHRNMRLIGLFGPILGSITNKDLVDQGYSASPEIRFCEYANEDLMSDPQIHSWSGEIRSNIIRVNRVKGSPPVDRLLVERMDYKIRELSRKLYTRAYFMGICLSVNRAERMVDIIRENKGLQVLIVVNKIKHGLFLQEVLAKNKIDSEFVCGQDTDIRRIKIRKDFISGSIKILIATMIYKEGIDVPSIDVLVNAMGEKAPVSILQIFGRGLRKRPGKKTVPVYDFYDKSYKTLEEHSALRMSIYKDEGFNPKLVSS